MKAQINKQQKIVRRETAKLRDMIDKEEQKRLIPKGYIPITNEEFTKEWEKMLEEIKILTSKTTN